jgi:glycosyltransferase involved in cell wall biosynthesis
MIADHQYKISVITAVYNAESCIDELIESLRRQEDSDFEWVVVDGLSTDSTLEILKPVDDLNIKIISEADFGIYDALNKGVKACSGEYYLVAGADDVFFPNAIKDYKAAIEEGVDLVTARIKIGNKISKPQNKSSWRFAQFCWVSGHALGLLIRKDLHNKFGYYSQRFPIAADQYFIKKSCMGDITIYEKYFLAGKFGVNGLSSQDNFGTCLEWFHVQLLTESKNKKWLITLFFIAKIFRIVRRL